MSDFFDHREILQLSTDFEDFLRNDITSYIRSRVKSEIGNVALYSLLLGGKRIRPLLCLLAAGYLSSQSGQNPSFPGDRIQRKKEGSNAEGRGLNQRALYTSAAIECIHTYSLIHDDLPAMDDDDMRRGQLSCHKKYSEWQAILAGDFLNTFAFELLTIEAFDSRSVEEYSTAIQPLKTSIDAVQILAKAAGAGGMICGQYLDLQYENSVDQAGKSEENDSEAITPTIDGFEAQKNILHEIHLRKTGALIRTSLQLGALVAGCTGQKSSDHEDVYQNFSEYGDNLGLLFQISDDLLDISGSTEALGKTPGKDASSGKLTFPALYGEQKTREMAENLCAKLEDLADTLKPGPFARADYRNHFKKLPRFLVNRDR